MHTALILGNPSSGPVSPLPAIRQAEQTLRRRGWRAESALSTSGPDLVRLTRQAVEAKTEVVFVAGGDGSLHLAIQALAGTHTALATLPVGTANVWAQELGLVKDIARPAEIDPLLERLLDGRIYSIDLGCCNEEYFLTWCGVGIDARTIHEIEPRPRWAKRVVTAHYGANILWQIPGWRGSAIEFELDGRRFSRHCILALASNVRRYFGGKTRLADDIFLDDGMQELWLFNGSYPWQSFEYALRLLANRHHNAPGLERFAYRQLKLKAEPLWLQMDGDPLSQTNPLHLNVAAGALRILAPAARLNSSFRQAGERL